MARHSISQLLILALLSNTIFSACAKQHVPNISGLNTGTAPTLSRPAPAPGIPGTTNGTVSVSPDAPLDTPEPLPAPTNPVQPGAPFQLKTVSNTTAFAVPRFSKWFQVNGVYVHIALSWQPVNGAAEYWIYKNRLPQFNEARRDNAHAIVKAGFANAGYKDGLEPPNLQSGGFWDRMKRAIGTAFNRPGETYTYKVIAADANGVAMSESNIETAVALPAISSATMNPPTEGTVQTTANGTIADVTTVNPLFTWNDAQQGLRPDGYYVSVFPSVQFTQDTLPPMGLAYWSTFRPAGTNVARYGEDSANQVSYRGTLPFDISFDLQPGKAYSWSVVGIKTDTGDMRTAKAISRSWSGFGHFRINPNATVPPTRIGAQSYSAYNTTRNQPYGQATYPATNYYGNTAQAYPQTYGQTTSYNRQAY